MSNPITLYIDLMSQPSRAVYAFCLFNKIPHKVELIQVMKGQHLTPEFRKKNPLRRVPAIDDNGFVLPESHAILRYLSDTMDVVDHWYPKDPKQRAMVDRYLDWHHTGTRRCARYFLAEMKDLFPAGFITWTTESERGLIEAIFRTIEGAFLKNKNYIASDDQMTIADLSAVCEIMQLRLTKFDFSKFPKLEAWINRCMSNPELQEAHKIIFKAAAAKPKL